MVPPTPASAPSATTAAGRRKKIATSAPDRAATDNPAADPILDPQEQYRYIAEAAYYIAEQRGFSAGSELEDWLQAERQIARLLSATSGKSH